MFGLFFWKLKTPDLYLVNVDLNIWNDFCGFHWGVEIVCLQNDNLSHFILKVQLRNLAHIEKNDLLKNQFSLFTYFMATEEVWHFDGSFVKDGGHNVSK